MARRSLAGYGSQAIPSQGPGGPSPDVAPQRRRAEGLGTPPAGVPPASGPPISPDPEAAMNPSNVGAYLGGMEQGQQGLDQMQQLLQQLRQLGGVR